MRKLLIPLLLFFSFIITASAQEQEADTSFWDISIYASPDYAFRFLSGSSVPDQDKAFFDQMEKFRIGYTAGVYVSRPIARRLSIQFGLQYQSQGYKVTGLTDSVLNYRDSLLYTNTYDKSVRYSSLNIPVILKINMFHAGRTAFDFNIGLSPVITLGKREVSVFEDGKEYKNSWSGNDFDLQAIAGISVYIPLSSHYSLTLEPIFRYNIFAYKDQYYNGVKRSLFSAGLGLYFTYKVGDNKMYDYYYKNIYNQPPKPSF